MHDDLLNIEKETICRNVGLMSISIAQEMHCYLWMKSCTHFLLNEIVQDPERNFFLFLEHFNSCKTPNFLFAYKL